MSNWVVSLSCPTQGLRRPPPRRLLPPFACRAPEGARRSRCGRLGLARQRELRKVGPRWVAQ
eukprot:4887861-Alexandrium_andersonii.AAC.1